MLILSEKIRAVPSFRPLLCIVVGILTENSIFSSLKIPLTSILPVLFVLIVIIFLMSRFSSREIKSMEFLIILGFFTAGIFLSSLNHSKKVYPGKGIFLAEVISLPASKPSSVQLRLKLINDAKNENRLFENYYINAYFSKESQKEYPAPGDVLLINTELNPNTNAGNPSEFDYAGYLNRKRIFSTVYLPDSCWEKSSIPSTIPDYLKFTLQIRQLIQNKIKEAAQNGNKNNYQVMLAICTGNKSELDREIKTQYSQAGAIHVMAVSGLHVGMIWMFLSYLTFFLKKNKSGRILQFILIIAILWLFALVTGMSASVVRSCFMFSIASAAGLIQKNASVYNSLSVSALIQLIINPSLLYDVGFQFSYSAVLSILMFLPLFQKIFTSPYSLIQKIFTLLSVSLAAQVLTFPLTLFYFHQFPFYFLLTNLCVIPLVTLIMFSFLSSLLFLFIPAVNQFFLYVSLFFTDIMTESIEKINALPFHIINDLHVTKFQVWLLISIPLLLLYFASYKKYYSLLLPVILIIVFLITGIYNYKFQKKDRLCVLNIRGQTAIDVTIGDQHYFICRDTTGIKSNINYASSGYWHKNYLSEPNYFLMEKEEKLPPGFFKLPGNRNYLGLLSDKKIVIINDIKSFNNYESGMWKKVDLIILGGYKMNNLDNLFTIFPADWLIWDSSIPPYYEEQAYPDSGYKSFHRVTKNGAFLLEL